MAGPGSSGCVGAGGALWRRDRFGDCWVCQNKCNNGYSWKPKTNMTRTVFMSGIKIELSKYYFLNEKQAFMAWVHLCAMNVIAWSNIR